MRICAKAAMLFAFINMIVAAGETFAQDRGPLSPHEQPVSGDVPIGCLLSPKCGPKLFLDANDQKIRPDAPVDPGQGLLPCLLRTTCASQLGGTLNPVTVEQVIKNGTKIGDYIPQAPAPNLSTLDKRSKAELAKGCTEKIIQLSNISEKAQTQSKTDSDALSKRSTLIDLANSHNAVMTECANLRGR